MSFRPNQFSGGFPPNQGYPGQGFPPPQQQQQQQFQQGYGYYPQGSFPQQQQFPPQQGYNLNQGFPQGYPGAPQGFPQQQGFYGAQQPQFQQYGNQAFQNQAFMQQPAGGQIPYHGQVPQQFQHQQFPGQVPGHPMGQPQQQGQPEPPSKLMLAEQERRMKEQQQQALRNQHQFMAHESLSRASLAPKANPLDSLLGKRDAPSASGSRPAGASLIGNLAAPALTPSKPTASAHHSSGELGAPVSSGHPFAAPSLQPSPQPAQPVQHPSQQPSQQHAQDPEFSFVQAPIAPEKPKSVVNIDDLMKKTIVDVTKPTNTKVGKLDFGVEKEDKKPMNRMAPKQVFFESKTTVNWSSVAEDAFADIRTKEEEKPLPSLTAPLPAMTQSPFGVPMTFDQSHPGPSFPPVSQGFPPVPQQAQQQQQQFFGHPTQQMNHPQQGSQPASFQPTFPQQQQQQQPHSLAAPTQGFAQQQQPPSKSSDFGDFGDFGDFEGGKDSTFANFQQPSATAFPTQPSMAFSQPPTSINTTTLPSQTSSTPAFPLFDTPLHQADVPIPQEPPKKDFTPAFALALDATSATQNFTPSFMTELGSQAPQPSPAVPKTAPKTTPDFTPAFALELDSSHATFPAATAASTAAPSAPVPKGDFPASFPHRLDSPSRSTPSASATPKKDVTPAFAFDLDSQPTTTTTTTMPAKKDFVPAFMLELGSSSKPPAAAPLPSAAKTSTPSAASDFGDFGDFGDFSAPSAFPPSTSTTTTTFATAVPPALSSSPIPTSNSPLDSNTKIDKAGVLKAFHLEITSPQLKHAVPPVDKYSFFAELREETPSSDTDQGGLGGFSALGSDSQPPLPAAALPAVEPSKPVSITTGDFNSFGDFGDFSATAQLETTSFSQPPSFPPTPSFPAQPSSLSEQFEEPPKTEVSFQSQSSNLAFDAFPSFNPPAEPLGKQEISSKPEPPPVSVSSAAQFDSFGDFGDFTATPAEFPPPIYDVPSNLPAGMGMLGTSNYGDLFGDDFNATEVSAPPSVILTHQTDFSASQDNLFDSPTTSGPIPRKMSHSSQSLDRALSASAFTMTLEDAPVPLERMTLNQLYGKLVERQFFREALDCKELMKIEGDLELQRFHLNNSREKGKASEVHKIEEAIAALEAKLHPETRKKWEEILGNPTALPPSIASMNKDIEQKFGPRKAGIFSAKFGHLNLAQLAATSIVEAVKQLDMATKYYQRMNSNEFTLRSKNWASSLEACVGDIEKVSSFAQELVIKKKEGSISQTDINELFGSKQVPLFFKDFAEVMRIVYRIEISFDITKDFVPDAEAANISKLIERAKTLNDQVEHNLKTLDVANKVVVRVSKDAVNLRLFETEEVRCGVCYLTFWKKETAETVHDKMVPWGHAHFHAPCANYWVNRVSQSLPAN